ncbi:acyltransferase domain-containing protein [uncultured Sutterella sp.]|mgnify:CR=1 FL=1|uniref:acyltransferase domain-containing protein n=1 Tax=uncultured Sutterella sp. TaxID=286133 RepID=UPI00260198CB|nr:acyltransferase domain-containing protein [uncultured Sutterella sp.]
MRILFAFPGQGAQRPGMLHDLDRTPFGKSVIGEMSSALGLDLLALDTGEAFERTENVQLALLCAGMAKCRELEAAGIRPSLTAGLSIGAFGAAVAAGALALSDAARLVLLRGRLMQDAYPSGYGMTAIGSLPLHEVEKIADAFEDVYVANVNSEAQCVLSGRLASLDEAAEIALGQGASYAKRIRVTVPSHCPLLSAPAEELMKAFQEVEVRRPKVPFLSVNSGRAIWDPLKLSGDLAFNMARRTSWLDAAQAAKERGIDALIEMPPGGTLGSLAKKTFSDGIVISAAAVPAEEIAERLKSCQCG